MLEILQKEFHKKGGECQYCDNYSPHVSFPAQHSVRITDRGAEPSGCKGFIHCEAIPNDQGGITIIYACDSCGFGVTEDMEF